MRVRGADAMEYWTVPPDQSPFGARVFDHLRPLFGFIGEDFCKVGLAKPGSTVPPGSATRVFIFASARALIFLLSLSMISAGVLRGNPPGPNQLLVSQAGTDYATPNPHPA